MALTAFLEPLDTLFFRDNRPFSAGEDVFAETTLPSPLTVFGAIGSYILKNNNTDLKQFFEKKTTDSVLGSYDESLSQTKLKIKGPFLLKEDKIYFRPPANLYYINYNLHTLKPSLNIEPKWDIKDHHLKLITIPDGDFEPVNHFLSTDDVKKYLLGKITYIPKIGEEKIYGGERRFGHKLNRETLTVEEGFLYSTEHLRFEKELLGKEYVKSGIVIFIDGLDNNILQNEVIHLGGEKKMALLKKIDRDFSFHNEEVITKFPQSKRFFLYFITLTIFSDGFNKGNWPQEFQDMGAKLVGATVNKPIYISGWKRTDISAGHPRPLKKAVPQGSVYFFECKDVDENKFKGLYDKYNFNESLSDEYPCAGFGIALIGVW